MKITYTMFAILIVFAFSLDPMFADSNEEKQEINTLNEKIGSIERNQEKLLEEIRAMRGNTKLNKEKPLDDVDIDNIIKALTVIVEYQDWRKDQRAMQNILDRRYNTKKEESPFTFQSEILKNLLQDVSKDEFDRSIEDIETALEILKDYKK